MPEILENKVKSSLEDCTSLFVITVSDIYIAKAKLLDYLPLMVKRATDPNLKFTILQVGISISAELLRLNIILATLKQTLITYSPFIPEMCDLDKYLERELDGVSHCSADVLLLFHLSLIESKEAEAFRLLKKLASRLQNRWVLQLLDKNLTETLNSKQTTDQMLESYIMQ